MISDTRTIQSFFQFILNNIKSMSYEKLHNIS